MSDLSVFEARELEVRTALAATGDARYGEAVRADRRSELLYLGVSAPDVRRIARQQFSFSGLPAAEVLATWDALWRTSEYGEVLFAAIEYCLRATRKQVPPELWPVVRGWTGRVDNWAHADALGGLVSRIVASDPEDTLPVLAEWNGSPDEWLRRMSLVSLIHYTGKNAVFLPPKTVFPQVERCIGGSRHYVATAVGWVLREMSRVYPEDARSFLIEHAPELAAAAFARATEKLDAGQKAELRALRRRPTASPLNREG